MSEKEDVISQKNIEINSKANEIERINKQLAKLERDIKSKNKDFDDLKTTHQKELISLKDGSQKGIFTLDYIKFNLNIIISKKRFV